MKKTILTLYFILFCLFLLAQIVPHNLIITRDGSSVELTWDEVSGADHYNIYRSSIPDADVWGEPVAQVSEPFHSEIASPDKYFYRVTAVDLSDGQFTYVPGGTFIMGDTIDDGIGNEIPAHSVTLSSFFIGKYEVSQSEYSAIMGSNPASGYGVGDNYPVYEVSWYSMLKYCNLRSLAENLSPCYTISGSTNPADWGIVPGSNNATWNIAICNWNANGYRLPTEAEWEYAVRGATTSPDYLYAGSNSINAVAWYYDNAGGSSHPVGTKALNGIGTYDMSGNLWEVCWDWYSTSYYGSSPSNDPTGPVSGTYRVKRGGGWFHTDFYSRVANRTNFYPSGNTRYDGFRLCRTAQ